MLKFPKQLEKLGCLYSQCFSKVHENDSQTPDALTEPCDKCTSVFSTVFAVFLFFHFLVEVLTYSQVKSFV